MVVQSSTSSASVTSNPEKAIDNTPRWTEYAAGGLISHAEADLLTSLPSVPDSDLAQSTNWLQALDCIVSVLERQVSQEASRALVTYLHRVFLADRTAGGKLTRALVDRVASALGRIIDQHNDAGPGSGASALSLEAMSALGRLTRVSGHERVMSPSPSGPIHVLLAKCQKCLGPLRVEMCISAAAAMAEAAEVRNSRLRLDLASDRGCLEALLNALTRLPNQPQLHYDGLLILWLISFDAKAASALLSTCPALIPCSVAICRATSKEKVIRVAVGLWRNLLKNHDELIKEEALSLLIGSKAHDFVAGAVRKAFPDPDLSGDLLAVAEELESAIVKLSGFDEYVNEVKLLIAYLGSGRDPKVMSIAAHDLGEYLKHYPTGKRFLDDLGAKKQLMALITHPDPDVRYHTLNAVQTYVTCQWQ